MKPGIQTTEFWVGLVVIVMGALATAFADSPWAKVGGLIASALAAAGYGLSRGMVKK